jgi:hypothetical protein
LLYDSIVSMNEIEFSMALLFWVDDPIAQDLGCYKNEEAPDCVSFSSPSQDSSASERTDSADTVVFKRYRGSHGALKEENDCFRF